MCRAQTESWSGQCGATGRKFHAADEQLLERAQKLLHEEFAFVLHILPEEVPLFITRQLEAAEK